MTGFDSVASTKVVSPKRVRPRIVTVAFWLWSPFIAAQGVLLGWLAVLFVIVMVSLATIKNSGPGEGFALVVLVPFGLMVFTLIAAEITLLFLLRRGIRGARTALMVLAITLGLIAAWLFAATAPSREAVLDGAGNDLALGAVILTTIHALGAVPALVGGFLPYHPRAADYFAKPPQAAPRS